MDVERTIEFLLKNQARMDSRMDAKFAKAEARFAKADAAGSLGATDGPEQPDCR